MRQFLLPIFRFLFEIVLGSILFVLIGFVAVAIGYFSEVILVPNVGNSIPSILKSLQYVVLTTDIALYFIFTVKIATRAVRDLWKDNKGTEEGGKK